MVRSALCVLLLTACAPEEFPPELTRFADTTTRNPVFVPPEDGWDREMIERGYILRDTDGWHFWYTASDGNAPLRLGHARSDNGMSWRRDP
jgi:beta-1,2-mannobiose phosphorylase / 1,2-beta-oligomannan phosphorylase